MSMPLNILLITTDEERFNVPRPAGFSLPGHERLAADGVSFRRYYAASAMCSSSRSVIYTGRHLPITQIYDNDNLPYIRPLDPALGTIGTMLRAAGYYCTYQGKWHLANLYVDPARPHSTVDALEPYGFSEWNDWGDLDGGPWAGLQVDPVIAGQAAKWLRDRAPVVSTDRPWFMAVNFVNPHDIMSFDYGGRTDAVLPGGLDHAVAVRPPAPVPTYQVDWDVDLPDSVHDDLSDVPAGMREFDAMVQVAFGRVSGDDAWRAGLSYYLNCLRDVDRNIETVLDALVASGQAERTIVIFTSDHGEMAGSHGLRQKGNLVYDENFHVPLIICHPEVAGGVTTDALGSAVDLAPTVLACAGVDDDRRASEHPGLNGHSLVPALEGQAVRDGVLTAVESILTLDAGYWRAIATGSPGDPPPRLDLTKRGFLRGFTDERYTFGRYFSPLEPNRPADLTQLLDRNDVVLFDRATDPGERHNLAYEPQHAPLVDACRARLEALISAEVGADEHVWVAERAALMGANG